MLFLPSYGYVDSFSENFSIINSTNDSILELSSITNQFETRFSNIYPHLPIHIFTQNLSLVDNTSKLILLGNGFFGDRNWRFAVPGRSSTEKMTSLYCPFLSDRCDITNDYNRFSEADAVVYHMRDRVNRNLAKQKRHSKQRFVFALWEPPVHTYNLRSYYKFFNWTMTYRFDSHIITSYYSGNAYVHTSSNFYHLMIRENSTRTAAALISNCWGTSKRLKFIKKLKRYIDVKIYGRCGEPCPSKMDCRQFIAENYYFILSFENSLCLQYTTEKFFAALEYPVVPLVSGRTNYSYFIPSSGYIDVNQFSTMSSLAQYLNETRSDKEKYLSYFSWKKDYIWGLGDFFTPFCDLCLRLHLDSQPNIVDNIHAWWFYGACQKAQVSP
ncbi:unnamed protein product [Rotaria sordida]|uniref:Fucosyltransferase n=1 Tax=Rotaria sordida TaxID=392033 RepID=A0A820CPL0_9BILA|nr:unnamed protein product [Rotaria sordida]CAF4220918.1 unnamed protein product [Rotaria sordida]